MNGIWGNVGGIGTRLRAGGSGIRRCWVRDLYLLKIVRNGSGAHLASSLMGNDFIC
jgi:hypothetical protein